MAIPELEIPSGGTAASNPDLNWSQVRETILMLGLSVAQIRQAMLESTTSLDTLTDSFAATHGKIDDIRNMLHQLATPEGAELEQHIAEIDTINMRAVVAFQFYDRLTQRLDHACGSIACLADLVADPQRLYIPREWLGLQERIRSQFTMEQEHELFANIMKGMSLSEALKLVAAPSDGQPASGDVELF
ncbi:hypothetical protein [Chitinilyticum piscinae]|uniref:Uncharacterized protein n=1 Tax=Chitinilyticum piscinae TaxID=2866724 RepID=A0A8J7FM75_9NEIS|nr:hypothetical protein [Chitinilyticum piscinae]MBE9610682.1 hypothetical protein [Chitinilyticum piscinae]